MERTKRRWPLGLGMQLMLVGLVCAGLLLISFTQDASVGGVLYDVSMWGLIPLAAGLSSYLAVRLGLHYFLAWIAPPILQIGIHAVLTAILPASPGMPMVTLLICVLGAAAGEERNRRGVKKAEK